MKTLEERFWAKVKKTKTCWLWTAVRNQKGYGRIVIGKKLFSAHRIAWSLKHGAIPEGLQLDHTCHNPSCVNPDHLRLATQAQNQSNQKRRADNTSQFKGVSWDAQKNRWRADIQKDKRRRCLGAFENPEDAHKAYCKAAKRLHGKFANFGEAR